MKTPVILIIFNRPDLTAMTFERIRQAKPPALVVVADGPRPWRPDDKALVAEARRQIRVDWNCDYIPLHADENLGCGVNMGRGITEAFKHVERAVMLEDDVLPHPDYFKVVDELLDRYEHDKHIWCISGARASREQMQPGDYSYYFTHQVWTCSLATWRDRWAYYDFNVNYWADPLYRMRLHDRLAHDPNEHELWFRAMNEAFVDSHKPRYQTADYQFQYWVKAFGYGIVTSHNMITNTGFRPDGTNATDPNSPVANLPAYGMKFPLDHPDLPDPLPWAIPAPEDVRI